MMVVIVMIVMMAATTTNCDDSTRARSDHTMIDGLVYWCLRNNFN